MALRLRRLRRDQLLVLGERREDLVTHAASLQQQFEALSDYVQDAAERLGRADDARPRSASTGRSPIARWCAMTPTARCRACSRPRSRCSTPPLRRGRLLDPPSRPGPGVRQAGARGALGDRALARGERGDATGAPAARRPDRALSRAARGCMRVGYLGPEGTFTHEAMIDSRGAAPRCRPSRCATIFDTIMAVHSGDGASARSCRSRTRSRARSTSPSTRWRSRPRTWPSSGEVVHPIRHCLIARTALELDEIEAVVSHPQANGAVRALHPHPAARRPGAVRQLDRRMRCEWWPSTTGRGPRWAPAWPPCATAVRCCGPASRTSPATRPASCGWPGRAPAGSAGRPAARGRAVEDGDRVLGAGRRGARAGWSSCLSEFASREVNLTRIESRPRKQGLGRYMFFCDIEGRERRAARCRRRCRGCANGSRRCACSGPIPAPDRRRQQGLPVTARAQVARRNRPVQFSSAHGHFSTRPNVVRVASAPATRT